MQYPDRSSLPFLEIEQESHHRGALAAITLACLLLVIIKGNALLQYWQQTHHILMGVGSLPAPAQELPGYEKLTQWQTLASRWVDERGERLRMAGQFLLLGNKAMPEPPPPVVRIQQCPEPIIPAQPACPPATATQPNEPSPQLASVQVVDAAPRTSPSAALRGNEETSARTADEQAGGLDGAILPPTPEQLEAARGPIPIHQGDRILLVGDSLMQGVAPHVIAALRRTYRVESMDLSRHSTGLTYPAFFDWPATVEAAFELEAYQAVIVFLGANDPWDMNLHGSYTRFGSDRWREVYSERVKRIIQTASDYQARLIWLGIPPMGREDLAGKETRLNDIYAKEVEAFPLVARFVPTAPSLSLDGSSFTKFLELPDRGSVMVRTDDGVHFTTQGQKLLASLALAQFTRGAAPENPAPHEMMTTRQPEEATVPPSYKEADTQRPLSPELQAVPAGQPPPEPQPDPTISQR